MPERADPLDLYRSDLYALCHVGDAREFAEYHRFLQAHYEPLGFFCGDVLPTAQSMMFAIRHCGELAAIFRLTPVQDLQSRYFDLIPGAKADDGAPRRLLEVNNVVIARPYRASIVLGLILYHSACLSHAAAYHYVVGLNRFQVLRFFVDFGVIPAEHAPVSLLGREHLQDFVNYYDTADPASIAYMHERARRYFHQELVMRSLREKYVRPGTRKVFERARGPARASQASEERQRPTE
jgi:hypothetical protein